MYSVCTLRVTRRVANSATYAPLEHICAYLFREDARYPPELPGLAYNLYPKAGNNIFIMQYSLTKVLEMLSST